MITRMSQHTAPRPTRPPLTSWLNGVGVVIAIAAVAAFGIAHPHIAEVAGHGTTVTAAIAPAAAASSLAPVAAPAPAANADQQWVALWHEEVPTDTSDDATIVALAQSICKAVSLGITGPTLDAVMESGSSVDPGTADGLVRAAIGLYCPSS